MRSITSLWCMTGGKGSRLYLFYPPPPTKCVFLDPWRWPNLVPQSSKVPFAVRMQLPITQHYITFWTILKSTKRVKEAVSSIWGPISWGSQRLFYRSFRKIKRILPCPVSQRPIKHERDPLAMDSHLTTKCMAGYFTFNLFSCLLPHFLGDQWHRGTIYLAMATAKIISALSKC